MEPQELQPGSPMEIEQLQPDSPIPPANFTGLESSVAGVSIGISYAALAMQNILQEINKFKVFASSKVAQDLKEMKARADALRGRIDATRHEMSVWVESQNRTLDRLEIDQLARINNMRVSHKDHVLTPLYAINGNRIDGFPKTTGAIEDLDEPEMDRLLELLGLPLVGEFDEKKKNFRRAIGLRFP